MVERAERALAEGDYETAIAAYTAARARTPWNDRLRVALVGVYAERARTAHARGDLEGVLQAESDLRSALELAPDDLVLRRSLAVVLADRANRSMEPEVAARFRAEARSLDPEAEHAVPAGRPDVERRLDLAYELLERGQLEAGIFRLEGIYRDHPDHPGVASLLAQALVRQGNGHEDAGDHAAAAESFERAVAVYAESGACQRPCDDPGVRLAHNNRIVAWLNASRPEEARRALAEAGELGLSFPRLERALRSAR